MDVSKVRLLLIEDNPVDVEILREVFNRDDRLALELAIAQSAEEALSRDLADFDLILCDYKLDGLSGIEFMRGLKERGVTIPVIMMSGQGDEIVAVEAMKLGVSDYVIKSVDSLSAIPMVIRNTLERHKVEEEKKRLGSLLLRAERLDSLGRLAGSIAHEINTPLAVINTSLEMIRLKIGEDYPCSMELDYIKTSTDKIASIIRQLLDFYQPSTTSIQKIEINPVLTETVNLFRHKMKISNIELDLNLDSALPMALASTNQLKQVFFHLIQNAMDAMPKGGNLWIFSRKRRSGAVEIVFRDTGEGIPKESLPQIFEPFFTTRDIKKRGLGLSASYGIITSLEGEIEVSSEPEKGSTFSVILPGQPRETNTDES